VATTAALTLIAGALASAGAAERAQAAPAVVPGGGFVSLDPTRVLDTRTGLGAARRSVAAGATLVLQVAGRAGVPASGAAAVALNVTVTAPTGSGYLTVYPADMARPNTSNLNFTAQRTLARLVVTQLSSTGQVVLYNGSSGTVQLVADVSGYFAGGSGGSGSFVPGAPRRVMDTRIGLGAPKHPIAARTAVELDLGAGSTLPPGVSAVVVNVTANAPTAAGVIAVFDNGVPSSSNVNFTVSATASNLVLAKVRGGRYLDFWNSSAGTVQLVVDLSGYFVGGPALPQASSFGAVDPSRILDTRAGTGAARHAVPAGGTLVLQVAGKGGVLTFGAVAVAINVTATASTAAGVVTVYADGTTQPLTSNLNYGVGQTVPNAVITRLGPDGKVTFHNISTGTVQLIADVQGYFFTATPPAGLNWQPSSVVDPSKGTLTFISCATTQFCVASDVGGFAFVYRNGSWSAGKRLPALALGISCPSTTLCVVVDKAGEVLTYDGSTWSQPVVVDAGNLLADVSCPSTTFCAAVDRAGRVLTFDGSTWGTPSTIDADPLTSVSCASSTMCVAVDDQGAAIRYNGTSWGSPSPVFSAPRGIVDCPSSTFCVAVVGDTAATYDGSTWTVLPAPNPGQRFTDISCASAALCVAQGQYTSGTWTLSLGTIWASASAPGFAVPAGISCVTNSFCLGVGDAKPYPSTSQAAVFNGSTWATPVDVDPPNTGQLTSVSCPTTTFCAAVDQTGYVTTFDGATWSTPTSINPDGISMMPNGGFTSVSCPTAGFCAAVTLWGEAQTYDGATWSSPVAVTPSEALSTVSCADAGFCVAVGDQAELYDGTSWTPISNPENMLGPSALSCPSRTFCLLLGKTGLTSTFNGTSWSAPTNVSILGSAISCPSAGSCVATDTTGHMYLLTNGTWSGPLTIPGASYFTSISCVGPSTCVAVDLNGIFPIVNGVPGPETPLTAFYETHWISCATATFCAFVDVTGGAATTT